MRLPSVSLWHVGVGRIGRRRLQRLNGPVNPVERRSLVGCVAPFTHPHRVPPTVRMHPLGDPLLALSLEASKLEKMESFGLLHYEVREERPYRSFSHLVVKAPSGQIPVIRSTRLLEPHATAKGPGEKLHRRRR